MHPKLSVLLKTQLVEKATIVNADHTQQKRKKRTSPFSSTITTYLGSTNPYKKNEEAQLMFIEDMMLYICKKYWVPSITKKYG